MERREPSNKRVYFGVFMIAIGVLWILERLDLISDSWSNILISWQMLLIGIGVFSLIGGNRTSGTVLIVIGSFFLLPEMISLPADSKLPKIGWPLLIILIGLVLLITHYGRSGSGKHQPNMDPGRAYGIHYFDEFVIFGGREVYIDSKNFFGGKTTTIFGGAEYDLRQAELSQNGAVIDTVSIFGGCGFKVPPDWTVKNEVTAVFGAFTDKRGSTINHIVSDPSKTLVIKGFAAFGGVEIKYM